MPVSQALGQNIPSISIRSLRKTLRAGEASASFGEVASRIADYQELEVTRSGQIIRL